MNASCSVLKLFPGDGMVWYEAGGGRSTPEGPSFSGYTILAVDAASSMARMCVGISVTTVTTDPGPCLIRESYAHSAGL